MKSVKKTWAQFPLFRNIPTKTNSKRKKKQKKTWYCILKRLNKATKFMRMAFCKHKYFNLLNSSVEHGNQHFIYVSMWFNCLILTQITFQDENLKKYCPSNSGDLYTAQAMVYVGHSAGHTTRSHSPQKENSWHNRIEAFLARGVTRRRSEMSVKPSELQLQLSNSQAT